MLTLDPNASDEEKTRQVNSRISEIAREVDSRITKIYADLVSLEKMMHYKRSIIAVLKDILPSIDADQGRRRTLIEELSLIHISRATASPIR